MIRKFNYISIFLLLLQNIYAQTDINGIINTYTPVVAFDLCNNSVTVINSSSFSVNDRVLIIQMKGATINQTNTSSFGDIANLGSAGLYEFGYVREINGNEIAFVNILVNSYDVAGKVQLIKVPQYTNANISANLTSADWDGEKGGVLAFEVSGTLTFNSNINTNGKGFRGGLRSTNFYSASQCSSSDYFFINNQGLGGFKGEGIAELTANMRTGRGKLANGGGGGNHVNSGGAGGANLSNGGNGGNEWSGCSNLQIGGVGGRALLGSNNRIFLGGGGGGGHQNDNVATSGSNGGAIVIIKANEIVANSASINNLGNSVQGISSNDGAGGAGAGGTILLDVNSISGNLTINLNGGKGGDTNNNPFPFQCHGTGGGGSGGALYYKGISLPNNLFVQTNGGDFGRNTSSQSPCINIQYGAEAGQNGIQNFGLTITESIIPWIPIQPIVNVTNVSCNGLNDGQISLQFAGGNQNYNISWSNGQTGFSLNNLSAGTYSFTVTNNLNCSYVDSISIIADNCCNFNVSYNITTPSCNDSNGIIDVNILTGSGQYSYMWSNGDSTEDLNNIYSGSYSVTILDLIWNCSTDTTFSLSDNSNLITIDTVLAMPEACIEAKNGSITVVLSDTINDYNIIWSNGDSTLNINQLSAGNYMVTITDEDNCRIISNILLEPSQICCIVTVDITANPSDCSISNGSIIFYPDTGNLISNFEYSIDNGITFSADSVFNNLSANTYNVVIKYTEICELNEVITVNEPQNDLEITTTSSDVSCFGLSDGNIEVSIINGTNSPFIVSWSNGINDSLSIFNLPAGEYIINIFDQLNCSISDTIIISAPPPLQIYLEDTMALCDQETIEIDAGSFWNSYAWSNGSTQQKIIVNTTGVYTVTVTDNNGCETFGDVLILSNPINIFAGNDTIISNWDSIRLNAIITDPTSSGNIIWIPSDNLECNDCSNPLINNPLTAEYIVIYTDIFGCVVADTVSVTVVSGEYYFHMPNAFSPNQDGNNDFLFPILKGVKQHTWRIWDRWGEKIFECLNSTVPCFWDGTFKGKELNPGVYVWEAVVESKIPSIHKYKGSVVLIK